jgi:hypothetical protein
MTGPKRRGMGPVFIYVRVQPDGDRFPAFMLDLPLLELYQLALTSHFVTFL